MFADGFKAQNTERKREEAEEEAKEEAISICSSQTKDKTLQKANGKINICAWHTADFFSFRPYSLSLFLSLLFYLLSNIGKYNKIVQIK